MILKEEIAGTNAVSLAISKVYDDGKNKYIFSKGKVVATYNGHFYYDYYLRKYTFIN
ncbi:hypothetical protein SAMN04324257_00731 [Thermoanaerobacter thermohydrosulfuricus]|nr:hypothetical protein SAMN04324257_00731 [Thermoanaerobacter thermohydrosulfuricus]